MMNLVCTSGQCVVQIILQCGYSPERGEFGFFLWEDCPLDRVLYDNSGSASKWHPLITEIRAKAYVPYNVVIARRLNYPLNSPSLHHCIESIEQFHAHLLTISTIHRPTDD